MKMRLTMEQKRAVTGGQAAKYRGQKGRKAHTQVLDEVVHLTGYKRHYAGWLLRNLGRERLVMGLDGKPVRLLVG